MIRKLINKIFFIEILQGMALTLSKLFSHAVTRQYPDEKRDVMPGFRGLHALVQNADGTLRCVHCGACQAVCPSKCIRLSITKDAEGKSVKNYELEILRCVFCALCVEACPYGAIVLTEHYEYCHDSREPFRMTKPELLRNWEAYLAGERGEEYLKKFWLPKSEDFLEREDQAVFDKSRIEKKKASQRVVK
ncbi:MAG: NuoI/complex I 23 kDa subunit family protein [Dissulfurispiraceae bacterium]